MSHPTRQPDAVRDFSLEEVERLGRALGPHFRLIVREENEPIRAEIAGLKRRASLWGAVTGAITTALISVFGRWTGN